MFHGSNPIISWNIYIYDNRKILLSKKNWLLDNGILARQTLVGWFRFMIINLRLNELVSMADFW